MHFYFKDRLDKYASSNRYLLVFLLIWLSINLLQSAFTELAHDEAYYWMYSRNLEWGYFDHPPVIALLIKIGYSLFPYELGVRLLTSLMGTGTLFFVYNTINAEKRSLWLFIILTGSIVLVHSHIGGFLAIPDLPLLFFASLFFYLYKKYLDKDSYWRALLMGLVAALMLYSKYHGILILGFTLLANLKIMQRRSFWFIPVLAGSLFVPHLIWQINNGYPSVVYHLFTRSSAYKFDHTFNYIYSQLLLAGPFIGPIILYHAFAIKAKDIFNRVLLLNLYGVFGFFFLMSFKGHVEAHWTAIAYIPLLILAHNSCIRKEKAMLWLQRLFLPSVMLFLFVRVALAIDFLPWKISTLQELHNWDTWAEQIDSVADDRTVVFINSFQRPSKYTFYTGQPAHTLNDIYYRKNQYDIWPIEDSLQNKPVMLMWSRKSSDSLSTAVGETYKYELVDSFRSYFNFPISVAEDTYSVRLGDSLTMECIITNPRNEVIVFQPGDLLVGSYYNGHDFSRLKLLEKLDGIQINANDSISMRLKIPSPLNRGKHQLYLSIYTNKLRPALNSPPVKVLVK